MIDTSGFIRTLVSTGPAPDRAGKMGLYGWLIGDWTFDAIVHLDNGTTHRGEGKKNFVDIPAVVAGVLLLLRHDTDYRIRKVVQIDRVADGIASRK